MRVFVGANSRQTRFFQVAQQLDVVNELVPRERIARCGAVVRHARIFIPRRLEKILQLILVGNGDYHIRIGDCQEPGKQPIKIIANIDTNLPGLVVRTDGILGTMFGASMHGELELLVAAGLTPEEALRAATSTPADCFKLADRGRVAVGKRADLLLVTGDLTVKITDSRNIVAVWKSGHADDRSAYAAEIADLKKASSGVPPLALGDGIISTFEDGTDHAAFGAGWSKSTDALFGGKSITDYKIISGGANGTKKSLRVTGEIVAGLPYNWAGAMFTPGDHPFAPANLSKTSGLKFWAKGDGKTYRLMFFTVGGGNIPQVATFTAGSDWKQYSFPFSTFGDSDGHDVQGILFSGGPEIGKFNFQIDEVGLVPKP